jgi:hypothetical protein
MQSEITERIVRNEIYLCQSSLIEKCFESLLFSIDDIENLNDAETDEYQEIFEWWATSDWLADKLREHHQPILTNDYGTWWGRTCTGQAIKMDSVIEDIAESI